jgi:predicted nuclease of predicted toxin-antitoxin system
MRFLVDESTGPVVADWLAGQGREIFSVYQSARGMDDDDIVMKAYAENRILVTKWIDSGGQMQGCAELLSWKFPQTYKAMEPK